MSYLNNTTLIKHSRGISLIESMISMTLGLTIIGGLMSMYLGGRETDKTRSELIEIEASARIALNSLRQTISHAGYPSVENLPLNKPFQTPSDPLLNTSDTNPDCKNGTKMIINPALLDTVPAELEDFTKDGADDASDRITISYRADHPDFGRVFMDCAGGLYNDGATTATTARANQIACSTDRENNAVVGDAAEGMDNPLLSKIVNAFYLKDGTLMCAGSRSETAVALTENNIANMQILYGVFKDDATTYKKADDVESDDEWESVISVQVALLISSNSEVLEVETERTFDLLDKSITKDDKKMYKVYTTTIKLPNKDD